MISILAICTTFYTGYRGHAPNNSKSQLHSLNALKNISQLHIPGPFIPASGGLARPMVLVNQTGFRLDAIDVRFDGKIVHSVHLHVNLFTLGLATDRDQTQDQAFMVCAKYSRVCSS